MRYLVTGAGGMLGCDMVAALDGRDVTALTREQLDIRDPDAVVAAVADHDVIINAAGYTDVDGAESNEAVAYAVNADGAANLARAAAAQKALLVQVSTDYVFDGRASTPYDEDAPVAPTSAYGRTKAAAEGFVEELNGARSYIVRTAWLYGAGGRNFARTIRRLAEAMPEITVVDDQIGAPTWTVDLARQIVLLVDSNADVGIYHATNSGQTSWYGFARRVLESAGLDPDRVKPVASALFPRPAARPAYSVLGHDKWSRAGVRPMRPWDEAFADAVRHRVLDAE